MSIYSDQINIVLRDRLIPKMQAVSKDMVIVEQFSYDGPQLLSLKRKSDYYSMIYDFLEEYLVGAEQIDNDKLVNVVRLLDSPDSEQKGMDYLGTIPEKKARVRSGYTMYIDGIEVTSETVIVPGSVITITIVYGSTKTITGNKSIVLTSDTIDQTSDGFTIILQHMVIPILSAGTFLQITAQAKENGVALDVGYLFRVPIGDVKNLTGTITLVTTTLGVFTTNLSGTGNASIDWGDSSPVEVVTLLPGLSPITHTYSTNGGTILINTGFGFTGINASNQNITSAIIPKEFNKLETIGFQRNQITTFVTHREWVKLSSLNLYGNNLSVIDTYAEWIELQTLFLHYNALLSVINTFVTWTKFIVLYAYGTNISILNTFAEWTQLRDLHVGGSHLLALNTFATWTSLVILSVTTEPGITHVNTYGEWINLQQLHFQTCPITSVDTFNTWTKLIVLNIYNNLITTINTYSTWTLLQNLSLVGNSITFIDTYPEWTSLFYLALDNNPLTYFNAYKEWVAIKYVYASACALTNINDVLIQLDQTPIGTTGEIILAGGTNMGPFGLGLIAKASLVTKGLAFVTTNTEQFMSDVQGNQYAYRTIGTQTWMVENLKQTVYNDNSPIPNITLNTDWAAERPITGASDWFLPSLNELSLMGTELYNFNVGNFVPAGPDTARYWMSSEQSAIAAFTWDFGISGGAYTLKGEVHPIRACRSFISLINEYALRDIGPGGGLIYRRQVINATQSQYYEAAPADVTPAAWSNITDKLVGMGPGAIFIGDGLANTQMIMNQRHVGVQWFLPSQNELLAMSSQLKAFGVGNFVNANYWSSTNASDLSAFSHDFAIDSGGYGLKTNVYNVRAVTYFVSDIAYNIRDVGPNGGLIFAKILQSGITYQYYEVAPADEAPSAWSNLTSTFMPAAVGYVIGSGIPNTNAIKNFAGSTSGAATECYTKDPSYAETSSAARATSNLVTPGYGDGAYSWYNNDIAYKNIYGAVYNKFSINKKKYNNPMGEEYGALYNWYAATYNVGGASIAPAGWHVPTKTEWETLITYLGGAFIAGTHMKETGTTHWVSPDGDNTSGFSSRGSGQRNASDGIYSSLNNGFFGWSITPGAPGSYYEYENTTGSAIASSAIRSPNYGHSIRLVKDDAINTGTLIDIDGNRYPTITIGTQVWLSKSLNVTHYNNGVKIPNIVSNPVWIADVSGAMCYYNNAQPVPTSIFAPPGWHVPTATEFATLVSYLGGDVIAGGKLKEMGRWRWNPSNVGATNNSRFTWTNAGFRIADGTFYPGNYTYIWSKTPSIGLSSAINQSVNAFDTTTSIGSSDTKSGVSIRLIKD